MRQRKNNHPAIGIRPIIDGRCGVLSIRDSLEDQTMGMALRAKALFEENLKYSDGTPVKVVIADSSIGRVGEAVDCAEKFRKENVQITLSVTPCWCYGSETMDMEPDTIKGVWGFNGTERPGAVYLACVLAAHAQKGLPAFGIYGKDVQDADETTIPDDVKEKLLRFGRAALAAKQMNGQSYLQIGSACMGIAGSQISYELFEKYFGMRVESVDEVELIRRIDNEIYDKKEFEKAKEWVKANCKEGFDKNPSNMAKSKEEKEKDWDFTIKCGLIVQDLMCGNDGFEEKWKEERIGHRAICAGFQGQRQWTDFYPNMDFVEAICNTSFDWNGVREPLVLATENDTLNGASMMLLKLLTNKAQLFADVRTYWSQNAVKKATGYDIDGKAKDAGGFIHLINSGAAALDFAAQCKDENGNAVVKNWFDVTENDEKNTLNATQWCPADLAYFRGGGFSSRFVTEAEMPCTMVRLNMVRGLGPVLQLAEGWTVNLPADVTDKLWKRTDYTWPCTWFTPRCDNEAGSPFENAYEVMNHWGANHGAISYGHIGADLITLCSMLCIPVSMHNVPKDKIFRPAVWSSFGSDLEGQDYRACKVFGPK